MPVEWSSRRCRAGWRASREGGEGEGSGGGGYAKLVNIEDVHDSSDRIFLPAIFSCPEVVLETSQPPEPGQWATLLSVGRCQVCKMCDE